MILTGSEPALTQALLAGSYLSAICELLQRTVTTVPSGISTQLSSEDDEPLVGPAVHVFVTGS